MKEKLNKEWLGVLRSSYEHKYFDASMELPQYPKEFLDMIKLSDETKKVEVPKETAEYEY
jgi:hypothetical protein